MVMVFMMWVILSIVQDTCNQMYGVTVVVIRTHACIIASNLKVHHIVYPSFDHCAIRFFCVRVAKRGGPTTLMSQAPKIKRYKCEKA